MEYYNEDRAENRENAGQMLAQKFARNHFNNGIVVAVSPGGMSVASVIAARLDLPLEMMACRTIKDPSDSAVNIGAVSADDVYYHDCPYGTPQDYLYFQMVRLRNEIKYETEFYYGVDKQYDFTSRVVILVDDMLTSPDALIVSLNSIRKQRPAKLIVAVPFVQAEAARMVQAACDEFAFIKMKQRINSPSEFYAEFLPVDEWRTRDLLWQTKVDLAEAV